MHNPLMRLILQDYMAENANLYLTKCFGGAPAFMSSEVITSINAAEVQKNNCSMMF